MSQLCQRTKAIVQPGVPIEGVYCKFYFRGIMPNTGIRICSTCGREQPVCPNCGQWQNPPEYDCFNECRTRGFVPPRENET